jgi:hypothetical protein
MEEKLNDETKSLNADILKQITIISLINFYQAYVASLTNFGQASLNLYFDIIEANRPLF